MGDGNLMYFLIVVFVLWVLESIAKARQRSRLPEETSEDEPLQRVPTPVETSAETRPRTVERPPRTLWDEIAEIARQQLPSEQTPPERGRPPGRRADLPPPAQPAAPPKRYVSGTERTQTTRWTQGSEREVVVRPAPAEAPLADERRSERWLSGSGAEARSSEDVRAESVEASRRRAGPVKRQHPELERTAKKQVSPWKGEKGTPASAPRPAAPPPEPRRADRTTAAVLVAAPAARAARTTPQNIHNLRHASRAELRRILILQEVLGPPVALREGPLSEE
jgi:hypothetical protein